ncbi:tyrosine-type recombinase/integrase [Halorarum salinum]|uniref:Site-specific integrase n=1 Tax=Halorarum salinum TaxID=2743089 RepID=A0A7D5QDA4_9EURY|nr:phage integrase SAM-like domain-containing protein [Halobaculum salinum]QLG61941.1 site-specific integrase [Halobaculum salinum]
MADRPDDVELVKQRLSENPSEEFLEQIASTVVDEIAESFPEFVLKSRPMTEVLAEFREHKLEAVETTSHYTRKLDYLETYLQTAGITTTQDLTSEDVERYRSWRKYESLSRAKPLANNTLRDDMYLFREFIRYLIEHRMAPVRFEHCVEIPRVDRDRGEGVDEKQLVPEVAQAALAYLRTFRYATVEHVTMELMCQAGPRKSGLRALDVGDFNRQTGVLTFRHREGTPLKNNEQSEREITLYGQTPGIIRDHLAHVRPPVRDALGREPLLTKGDGRISPSMLQKIAYMWTRPCVVGLECPHDRDPDECEAAQANDAAFRCPSSRAPHHVRTGYITDQRNRGVSSDAIQQRCDVSPRVQALHYDLPDSTEERERFEDEFRAVGDDPESGYAQ